MCYCRQCHKVSAGFGTMTIIIAAQDFTLLKGELATFSRASDSGNENKAFFCADCGNRIYHQNPEKPELIRLKTGTLENSFSYQPQAHMWLQSAPDWVVVPSEVLQYQQQPTLAQVLADIDQQSQ